MENLGQLHISSQKNILSIKENIQELVARDKLLQAVAYIKTIFKDDDMYYDDTIILSMEVKALEKAIIQGRISWKKETKTRNILARRLLKMIDSL